MTAGLQLIDLERVEILQAAIKNSYSEVPNVH